MRTSHLLLSAGTALAMTLGGAGLAQAATPAAGLAGPAAAAAPPPTFGAFIASTRRATYSQYAHKPGGVASARAFGQMKSYLLKLYQDVQAVRLFEYQGRVFDCVRLMSQPTVTALKLSRLAAPPKVTGAGKPAKGQPRGQGHALTSPLAEGKKDAFGHLIACPRQTVPMERVTLAVVTRFPSLRDFLLKSAPQAASPDYSQPHRHAYGYQDVTNYGGNSWLNIWNPSGDFSLSQQWYVAGSGKNTQTLEGGWVRDPASFGNTSVLFIFYTPDNYADGCYDLDCPGFVQINNNWALGAGFDHYSSYGGTQWGFTEQWKYYQGNWWLFLQGPGSITAVGYYPGSVYNGGPMSRNAALMEVGGEVCNGPSGADCTNPDWPQMGSGKYAAAGFGQAAYQNQIFYIPRDENGGTGVWTSLTAVSESSSKCYTSSFTPASSGGSWGSYLFFGGPGGRGC